MFLQWRDVFAGSKIVDVSGDKSTCRNAYTEEIHWTRRRCTWSQLCDSLLFCTHVRMAWHGYFPLWRISRQRSWSLHSGDLFFFFFVKGGDEARIDRIRKCRVWWWSRSNSHHRSPIRWLQHAMNTSNKLRTDSSKLHSRRLFELWRHIINFMKVIGIKTGSCRSNNMDRIMVFLINDQDYDLHHQITLFRLPCPCAKHAT